MANTQLRFGLERDPPGGACTSKSSSSALALASGRIRGRGIALLISIGCLSHCSKPRDSIADGAVSAQTEHQAPVTGSAPTSPPLVRVEHHATVMATSVHLVAYTTSTVDRERTLAVLRAAEQEMRRLELLLSEWRQESQVGQVNAHAGQWMPVGPEVLAVIQAGLKAGHLSEGSFDITFQALGDLWRFGSAQDAVPQLPNPAAINDRRRFIDYRQVDLDSSGSRVRIHPHMALGLGGLAKGYIVDQTVQLLRKAGLRSFYVQAGGDLFGAGKKPDGTPWTAAIQDPRGPTGTGIATVELVDHAFSTAGDYARSFTIQGKRYHHIIDPKTGYPATASRSVTVWAPDALTADMLDDAVFVLGPERGLRLVESTENVGAFIVDAANRVHVSARLKPLLTQLGTPASGE